MACRGAALALLLRAASTSAQDASGAADPHLAARTVGYEGIAAYQAGDYVRADQKLSQAYRLLPVPSLGLWSARALAQRGFLVEASRRYTEVVRSSLLAGDSDVQRRAKQEAETELAALLPRIPRLALRLQSGSWQGVALRVDGIELSNAVPGAPLLVNPGQRVIEAQRGQAVVTERVTAVPSETRTVELRFSQVDTGAPAPVSAVAPPVRQGSAAEGPTERADADPWRTVGWIGVGVGGTALVLSGVTGLIAWGQVDDFDCSPKPCVSSDRDAVEGYNTLVTTSTVGYLAGGVLAGAGALLLLRERLWASDVTVGVGPQAVTLSGRF